MRTDPESERGRSRPPRTLVTGGAGFIGSHLTDLLLARGDHVTVVDNLSTGRRSNLPEAHSRLRFIEADLGEALRAFGRGEVFDEIYHLAAAVGVRLVVRDPICAIETNVMQTAALLRFAAEMGARQGRGVPTLIASSSEVYGKASRSVFAEDDDVVYGPTTVGRWAYACSKAVDEYLALAYWARERVPAVIVRFFNIVGPRQVGEYGMVLPRFVAAALGGRDLEVYGDGSASRCFCDVRDAVAVLPRLLSDPRCHGRVFNLGSDQPVTVADLADLVIRTLGSRSSRRFVPYEEVYGPGFEDLRRRRPDLSRLRQVIDFRPTIPLEQTIRDLAAAMSASPHARV